MGTALTEFLELLGGGAVTLSADIGEGLVAMAKNGFFEVDSTTGNVTGLNAFGSLIAIGGGIALAIGLTTKVVTYIFGIG